MSVSRNFTRPPASPLHAPAAGRTMAAMRQRFAAFRQRVLRPLTGRAAAPAAEQRQGPQRPALIVGLGNPGAAYGETRHNVGAWCVALLARRRGVRLERAGRVDRASIEVEGRTVHLARPRAMVNESGPPVAAEVLRLGLHLDQLLVIYDEIDLPLGQLRIRSRGGHGGHNGIRSLIDALGGDDFARVRIGVDRPYDAGEPVRDPERVADWVLSAPTMAERERLDETVAMVADAIELAAVEGIDIAMNRFNPRRG